MRSKTEQVYEPDAAISIAPGMLEGSNVNSVNELTSMIVLSRQFEAQVKLMKLAEQGDSVLDRLLQD